MADRFSGTRRDWRVLRETPNERQQMEAQDRFVRRWFSRGAFDFAPLSENVSWTKMCIGWRLRLTRAFIANVLPDDAIFSMWKSARFSSTYYQHVGYATTFSFYEV